VGIGSLMKRILVSLLAIGLMAGTPAMAQVWAQSFSSGEAREAVRDGKNVPLSRIFNKLKRNMAATS
jgi:predicted lipoprotein